MSLRLRRIEVDGFRKFRAPVVINGLTDGLNIIIEPNETGKSTLLEALRAAFFVRHSTKNQLAQSFAPHGEAIGPEITIAFDVGGTHWSVTKRFLKGAMIEVSGPQGRAQGEEAEARLHELLGSVRDMSQKGDPESYGALGLLWVAQTDALAVTAPGQIVRDAVRSTLEAEVGSIMGGPTFKKVRDRIEEQFARFWSPTGQKRGPQNDARERVEVAERVAIEVGERLRELEQNFADLESARTRLKVVQREMGDDTEAQTRKDLVTSLEVARTAAQILATRKAEHEAVSAKLRGLEDMFNRHKLAIAIRGEAQVAFEQATKRRAHISAELAEAKQRLADAREALETSRTGQQSARTALLVGQERQRTVRRQAALAAARKRHDELLELEKRQKDSLALAETLIPAKVFDGLEAHDRAVAEAGALLAAGATRIRVSGATGDMTIDGQPIVAGERTLTGETRIRMGDAELVILPPAGAASAESVLASALADREAALSDLGVDDLAAARARNEAARDAASELRAIEARIEAVTPADEGVGLAGGADALKLFVAEIAEEDGGDEADLPDMEALTAAVASAEDVAARAQGTHDSALDALRRLELEDKPLATAEAGTASDLANADANIAAIEARPEFATLSPEIAQTRADAAAAAVKLEEAGRDATAHDLSAINRKIETIDARAKAAAEARTKLEMEIARLEGIVEIEGGKGLADREAAAREEAEAARAALQRTTEEADTLKLLRETLDQAREETSAKFVGPVAKRARRYIERLLPGCDLSFSENLALGAVIRGGVSEGCADLSRGTQEQLAILTRIAFADMLLEQGRPVSLILDDPLVYSDDARLDLMVEILCEAAERMQVILLTCRERAFRHLPGHRLPITVTA
jgi:hypothetical protein